MWSWLWVHKIVLTGGLPAPQTPWRGACSPPCPPAYREALPLGLSVDLGTKILVPRSWHQDLATKNYGEPERRSLSVCRGARGAATPLPEGLGCWKPPSKNNFMVKRANLYTPSRTRFSNGLAPNRSKVSVKKSQIGFAIINFSRSIFPYMSNIYDNG